VYILATGGTISAKGADNLKTTGYTASTIGVQSLIDAVPEITRFADISGEQVTNLLSHCLTHDILLNLGRRINELFASDQADGVVVTHGTNTLEETAWFLNLVVKSNRPVVVTGAMRPATAISADGPANLLQSVIVAASQAARGQGAMVVFNNEIHAARDVTKTHTCALQTFRSPEFGPIGTVHEGTAAFFRVQNRQHTSQSSFDIANISRFPRVDILFSYLGDDDVQLKAVLAAGTKGIVVAATGNGMISDVLRNGLIEAAKQGVIIVRSTRCASGAVTSAVQDEAHSFVASGTLNPQKARILLMLALAQTANRLDIQKLFDSY
jgi:L-asparaginase